MAPGTRAVRGNRRVRGSAERGRHIWMSSNGLFGLVGTVEIAVVGVNEDGR